jgi:hypothetical protein
MKMINLTKAQRKAVKAKYDRNSDGAPSYKEFRKRVAPIMFLDAVCLGWCGMFLAIETDGYTHS